MIKCSQCKSGPLKGGLYVGDNGPLCNSCCAQLTEEGNHGWSENRERIRESLKVGKPVLMRQIGGITWLRMKRDADTTRCVNFDLFEYWIGDGHPVLPASLDPKYPARKRAKLDEALNAVRLGRAERHAPWPRQ